MAEYHTQWQQAKQTFERSQGAKPAPMGKVPVIGLTYRKGTGIDDALVRIDKLLPANLLDGMPDRELARLQEEVVKLNRVSNEYVQLLDASIAQEKRSPGGKAASDAYRDLKVLRAALQGLTAKVVLDLAKLRAANQSAGQDKKQTHVVIRTASESLQSAARDGLLWGQQLLQRPDRAEFDRMITTKARNITQPLANLRKWTMPDSIGEQGTVSREKALRESPALLVPIEALYHQVIGQGLKDAVLVLLRDTGSTTALNASLEELGGKQLKLPANATPQQVVHAVKHFMSMAKAAMDVGMRMQGLAARLRIPDALAHPEDVAPDFQAPAAPVRPPAARAVGGPPNKPVPQLPAHRTGGPPNKPVPQLPPGF